LWGCSYIYISQFDGLRYVIKKQGTILIVDDNRNILTTVRMLLEPIFDGIITIANPNSIPAKLREEHPDVVLLDMNFSSGINSGNEGLYWLREIKSLSPKTEVVLSVRGWCLMESLVSIP
jgi:two-component system, NtrC family, response regulator HydG